MARFEWDVQPYALVSELVDRYTRTVIATTVNQSEKRAGEAELWMKQNAPWKNRTPAERKAAVERGITVPPRHARTDLRVRVASDPNEKRRRRAALNRAAKKDTKRLAAENESRIARGLIPRTEIPKYRSQREATRIAVQKQQGPIVELIFQHGDKIWYGVWLEIAHQGRFGIISRAIDHFAPILMNDIKKISRLVQYNISFGEDFVTESQRFTDFVAQEDERFLLGNKGRMYRPWTPEHQAKLAKRRRQTSAGRRQERADIRLANAKDPEDTAQAYIDNKNRELEGIQTYKAPLPESRKPITKSKKGR